MLLCRGGGGGKALTMTMTPWNLTHGQWSKNLTMATDILEFPPWSMVKRLFSAQISWSNQRLIILITVMVKMVKMAIFGLIFCQNLRLTISTTKNLDFGYGHGRNFDYLTIVFSKLWPWS